MKRLFALIALSATAAAALAQTPTATPAPAAPAPMQGHPPVQGHPAMQGHPPMAGHPAPQAQPAAGGVQEYRLPAELFETPRMGRAGPMRQAAPQLEGTVVQAQTAGGYTYIEVTGTDGNLWLSAPAMNIAPGTRIRFEGGSAMTNFTSGALKRTFPTILFVGGVETVEVNEGSVVSAQTAGGYTYMEVKKAKGSEWLAVPAIQVKVGDKVRYEGGSVMTNFTSGALKRTFPTILFVSGVEVVKAN